MLNIILTRNLFFVCMNGSPKPIKLFIAAILLMHARSCLLYVLRKLNGGNLWLDTTWWQQSETSKKKGALVCVLAAIDWALIDCLSCPEGIWKRFKFHPWSLHYISSLYTIYYLATKPYTCSINSECLYCCGHVHTC